MHVVKINPRLTEFITGKFCASIVFAVFLLVKNLDSKMFGGLVPKIGENLSIYAEGNQGQVEMLVDKILNHQLPNLPRFFTIKDFTIRYIGACLRT